MVQLDHNRNFRNSAQGLYTALDYKQCEVGRAKDRKRSKRWAQHHLYQWNRHHKTSCTKFLLVLDGNVNETPCTTGDFVTTQTVYPSVRKLLLLEESRDPSVSIKVRKSCSDQRKQTALYISFAPASLRAGLLSRKTFGKQHVIGLTDQYTDRLGWKWSPRSQ